jgi:hypothetical protein
VPDPGNSFVEWRALLCDSTKVFICPCPEEHGSWLSVTLRDCWGQPLEGAAIAAAFESECGTCFCPAAVVGTDSIGRGSLRLRGGLEQLPDCCQVSTTVSCRGVAIPWAGTGDTSDTRAWLTPDMTGDCQVSLEDFGIFSELPGYARSDFNCDGEVDSTDYAEFEIHYMVSCAPVGVEEELGPALSKLEQNYPNPFNPLTRIAFSVAEPGRVVLRIYDVAGRPVRTLVDGRKVADYYCATWDGRDDAGRRVPSGVYFYKLEAPGMRETKKMLLLK